MQDFEFGIPEKDFNTAKGQWLDKQVEEKRFHFALSSYKDFGTGCYQITIGMNDPIFNGPRGDFYKNMFAKCPAGRPGTADEVANVAELLMSDKGALITGADFLIDGGATAFAI